MQKMAFKLAKKSKWLACRFPNDVAEVQVGDVVELMVENRERSIVKSFFVRVNGMDNGNIQGVNNHGDLLNYGLSYSNEITFNKDNIKSIWIPEKSAYIHSHFALIRPCVDKGQGQ
jgi:hypothetical protein